MDDIVSIHCEKSGKMLARRDTKGIYLWCKLCRVEHFIPWVPENEEVQKSNKVASEADLCYNLGR